MLDIQIFIARKCSSSKKEDFIREIIKRIEAKQSRARAARAKCCMHGINNFEKLKIRPLSAVYGVHTQQRF